MEGTSALGNPCGGAGACRTRVRGRESLQILVLREEVLGDAYTPHPPHTSSLNDLISSPPWLCARLCKRECLFVTLHAGISRGVWCDASFRACALNGLMGFSGDCRRTSYLFPACRCEPFVRRTVPGELSARCKKPAPTWCRFCIGDAGNRLKVFAGVRGRLFQKAPPAF